ncbi:MAG: 2-oxo acid dehydrogenase subunit E2 [Clostridia bacterium]|nr:2-oxo acid dehydrogenase subunit E2 [Clostridia bacterium]
MGDNMRADGTKLKNIDPMYKVAAHIMKERIDAMNMVTIEIPYEPIQAYVNKTRKEGRAVSHMAVIIAAYLQTAAEYPEVNRFIVNKKVYARNEYSVAMVVLKGEDGHGTMSKMYFELTDNVFEVNRKIEAFVEENRNSPDNNGTEKMIKFLLSVPGLLTVGVPFFKLLDRYGLLPKKIIDMSPFHNSLAISNLISIRTNATYHHCYNFGTTSIFMTMGNLKEVPKKQGDEIVLEKVLPLAITMDERICSGAYFAAAFRKMGKLLKNPELLETAPEKIIEDSGIKTRKKKK